MAESADPGLHLLLDLHGVSFSVDAAGHHVVRFLVNRVPASPERPHGLSYSLTLHDRMGTRLVGFDNAHAAPIRRGLRSRVAKDHRHRLMSVRPYAYRDAATLLADFWAEVDSILKERGALP